MAQLPTYQGLPSGGATPHPRVTANAGAAITAKGYEQLAFGGSATLDEAGAGSNTYAWAVAQAPAGSSVATGDIVSPTSLTGAYIAAGDLDMPGVYVFRLTVTDADTETGTSTVSVLVGTADGGLYIHDIDLTAEATAPWTSDGAVSVGALTMTLAGYATMTSIGIVNGVGIQGIAKAGASCTLDIDVATAFGHSGRRGGSYQVCVDLAASGLTAGNEHVQLWWVNAGVTDYVINDVSYISTTGRGLERTASGSGTTDASVNGDSALGIMVTGYDAQAVNRTGLWPADIDWSTETLFKAEGTNLETVNPGAAAGIDWSTDLLRLRYRSASSGGAFTGSWKRLAIIWYP